MNHEIMYISQQIPQNKERRKTGKVAKFLRYATSWSCTMFLGNRSLALACLILAVVAAGLTMSTAVEPEHFDVREIHGPSQLGPAVTYAGQTRPSTRRSSLIPSAQEAEIFPEPSVEEEVPSVEFQIKKEHAIPDPSRYKNDPHLLSQIAAVKQERAQLSGRGVPWELMSEDAQRAYRGQ